MAPIVFTQLYIPRATDGSNLINDGPPGLLVDNCEVRMVELIYGLRLHGLRSWMGHRMGSGLELAINHLNQMPPGAANWVIGSKGASINQRRHSISERTDVARRYL